MKNIYVKEVGIEEAFKVHKDIEEFDKPGCKQISYFEERYKNLKKLIIVAYYEETPIGYIVGYDRDNDGSFYCWLAGVESNYRRSGVLTELMKYFINWSKENNYNKVKIKTRNDKREMLGFLVKNNFNFTDIEKQDNISENELHLEYNLE